MNFGMRKMKKIKPKLNQRKNAYPINSHLVHFLNGCKIVALHCSFNVAFHFILFVAIAPDPVNVS